MARTLRLVVVEGGAAPVPGNPCLSSAGSEPGGSSRNTSVAPWLWHSSADGCEEPKGSTAGSLPPATSPAVSCHDDGALRQQGHPSPVIQ